MIPFNKPSITELEKKYVLDAMTSNKLCGDGGYTKSVVKFFNETLKVPNFLLTTSGTHALEMAAILSNVKEGDEVILPSYTFVSTANAFVLRGAKPVFCDVDKRTMNIDPDLIETLITKKTKVICPVHYAGIICDMDKINKIAKEHNLFVIEDAAQAVGTVYKGKYPAGTLGDVGCYSFHETKNYAMGEGGAVSIKDYQTYKSGEIVREKGTDRSQFIRGEVDKYTWQSVGSSFLPSDVLASMLLAQMHRFDEIMQKRLKVWNTYYTELAELEKQGKITRPYIPHYSSNNAHMFYIMLPTKEIRDNLIEKLRAKGVQSVFHYIPLHTSPFGRQFGYKEGSLPITEEYSARLLRLPLWADLKEDEVAFVIEQVKECLK